MAAGEDIIASSESGRESQLIPVTIDAELPSASANEQLILTSSVTSTTSPVSILPMQYMFCIGSK